jgi:haloacetate dehalogenase
MNGFASGEIATEDTTIFVRWHGAGPPLLLLHGFPETHLMWRDVATRLAVSHTVVCPDLRGYGRSGCPASAPDHAPYAKRAMARDMMTVMARIGFPRFAVAGHDRGGRVACRMALDFPERIARLAVLDIVPSEAAWARADATFALTFWPWSLLAQAAPLPERILAAAAEAVVDDALEQWGSPAAVFGEDVRAAYVAIGRPRPSIASTIERTPTPAGGLSRRFSRCGARVVRSNRGTRTPADRWVCGGA